MALTALDRTLRAATNFGRLSIPELRAVEEAPITALLTLSNPKTAKGEAQGYLTAILHLAPAALSGVNVCPASSAGCRAACLNTAGRGGLGLDSNGLNPVQRARIRKTLWAFARRAEFLERLEREIGNHCANAQRHGLKPAVRLNGTSDLRWETLAPDLFSRFADVPFYDYTKLRNRRDLPANYDLTLSASEEWTDADIVEATANGARVAVVFRSEEILASAPSAKAAAIRHRSWRLPREYAGVRVIDADKSDLRFKDPRGVICGLRAKGSAVSDSSGFVRTV